jgi:chromosome segregation ATPase
MNDTRTDEEQRLDMLRRDWADCGIAIERKERLIEELRADIRVIDKRRSELSREGGRIMRALEESGGQ